MNPQRCAQCFAVSLSLFVLCLLVGCASSTQTTFDQLVQENQTVNTQQDILNGTDPICIVIHARSGEWFFLSNT